MLKSNKIAVAVGAALALAYGSANAGVPTPPAALADADLIVNNFTILQGFGGGTTAKDGTNFNFCIVGPGCTAGPPPTANTLVLEGLVAQSEISGTMTGQTSFTNAVSGGTVNFPISHSGVTNIGVSQPAASAGPYTLFTNIPNQPTATYSAAAATAIGNSLDKADGSDNRTQAQTSINQNSGFGTAGSDLTLTVTATFSIGTTTDFEFNFDASSYLRAALGQIGINAIASTAWSIEINGLTNNIEVIWRPDGSLGSITTCDGTGVVCTEVGNPFDLTTNASAAAGGANEALGPNTSGIFELDLRLPAGSYTFAIVHEVNSRAELDFVVVPEPGTVALLGLGLLGLGVTARRRKIF